jgi:hypothetical protein
VCKRRRSTSLRRELDQLALANDTTMRSFLLSAPFIVRRDHRIVAAFARKVAAEGWRRCARSMTSRNGKRSDRRISGRRGGEMIRQVDKSHYNIPASGDPEASSRIDMVCNR